MKFLIYFMVVMILSSGFQKVRASPSLASQSVVSVLPVWSDRPVGPKGAPEGSGVVIKPGVIVTAWHVIEAAEKIDIRLHDRRILPAKLIAADPKSDIAVLSVEEILPPIKRRSSVELTEPVCAIGNAYGLGISIACGVISAREVSNAGFNVVEDFLQTDAAINPGMSGGALVDKEGELVGMISAIFASDGDANIGVNFAVSNALLMRVADALIVQGKVSYLSAGWRLRPAGREQLKHIAAPVIANLLEGGSAAWAGLKAGDILLEIGGARIFTPRDAVTKLALLPASTKSISLQIERSGKRQEIILAFEPQNSVVSEDKKTRACPYPDEVCQVRQAVFPIKSFNPLASATRITNTLLVTNRHVVGDRLQATLFTPSGPLEASVIPTAFPGDLVLLEAEGLPKNGFIPEYENVALATKSVFYVVGADVAKQEVRVFKPGHLISEPAQGAQLGHLHVTAYMQPGTSGGALVDETGRLVGISVGGGEGRFRAIPTGHIKHLLSLRKDPKAQEIHDELSKAFVSCSNALDQVSKEEVEIQNIAKTCAMANVHGQLLKAGRHFARMGYFEEAIALHRQAVEQVPHSVNARLSLLVSQQLGGRFKEMVPHARWVMDQVPNDANSLRFAIQSGIWGGAPEMAEKAYSLMLKANPQQAQAARRFIDSAPPAPPRR